ncbi:uncharacterized protein METZ01_LOCUS241445, partial [marine metagenome]
MIGQLSPLDDPISPPITSAFPLALHGWPAIPFRLTS